MKGLRRADARAIDICARQDWRIVGIGCIEQSQLFSSPRAHRNMGVSTSRGGPEDAQAAQVVANVARLTLHSWLDSEPHMKVCPEKPK